MVQNIDPLWFAFPVIVIAFSAGLLLFWASRRSLTRKVLLVALAAYAAAIALKGVVQILTASSVQEAFGYTSVPDAAYFGAQTAVFEVGGAFLLAGVAARRKWLSARDAEGYGLSLAFWENGVLLGVLTLLGWVATYAILSTGGSLADMVYSSLQSSGSQLLYGPAEALPLIAYGILERVTSLMVHLAWGILAVAFAVTGRKSYFLLAFPMGFIDSLVVYDSYLGLGVFEAVAFVIAAGCLGAAWFASRNGLSSSGPPAASQT
jgi:YhfC intramembrane metalloprotease